MLHEHRWCAVLLAGCTLVLALQRLHTYDEPLERDLTTYAVVGHEVLGGRQLYADLWDNKSPLVFATYAGGELIAGYGERAIFVLGLGAATLTLLGVAAAAWVITGSRAAGLWAAAAWTLESADQALQANQPNIEVFLNASLVWIFVLLATRRARPVLVGVLSAAASLYKLVVIPTLVLWQLVHVIRCAAEARRSVLREVALSTGTFFAVWMAVVGYFAATGRAELFRQAVFTYNESFAGSLLANLLTGLTPDRLFPRVLWCAAPLAVLAAIGFAWLMRSGRWRCGVLWLAYTGGTVVSVALPGRFWPHYYQLWLPVLAIGAGIGVHALAQLSAPIRARTLGVAALAGVLAFELPYYGQSAAGWSRAKYGDVFVDAKRVAAEIDTVLAPGETFYEWGDETGFYYYTRRRPPSGIFYVYPVIVAAPLRPVLEERVLRDLEKTRPELLVVNTTYLYPGMQLLPLGAWLGANYSRWDDAPTRGYFQFFVRNGGALDGRVRRRRDER